MANLSIQKAPANKLKRPSRLSFRVFWILLILGLALLTATLYQLSPYFINGYLGWRYYLNPQWAHNPQDVERVLQFSLAIWLVFTVLYFDLWFMRRLVRKIRGKPWGELDQGRHKHYLPRMLPYLKISCLFLAFVWIFIVLQYPLQFM